MKKIFTFSLFLLSYFSQAQTALWGTTQEGGTGGIGTVYFTNANNSSPTTVYSFSSDVPGKKPYTGMIEPIPGFLYGMTSEGGTFNKGVIYKYEIATGIYTKIHDFDLVTGERPLGGLMQASNGLVYGMTSLGGADSSGVIFALDPTVDTLAVVYSFTFNTGIEPRGRLLEKSPGILYGLTYRGGNTDDGVLFKFEPAGNIYTKILDFNAGFSGKNPRGSLVLGPGNIMYGTCESGGTGTQGTFFKYEPPNPGVDVLANFNNSTGFMPIGELCYNPANNVLYGTCFAGGANSNGTIFTYTSGLFVANIHDFDALTEGAQPHAGLTLLPNGNLIGTTYSGGPSGFGTSFSIDTTGSNYTVQSIFDYFGNGARPTAPYFVASDGRAYLATFDGGEIGQGFLVRTDNNGSNVSGLKEFNGPGINGGFPLAKLCKASNGLLYGSTTSGGVNGAGVVFSIDPNNNQFTKVCDLSSSLGKKIRGQMVQTNGQKLYALCYEGGQFNFGSIIEIDISSPPPVVPQLKISLSSALGTYPLGGLALASNGKIYGTTSSGGANGNGVLFEYNPVNNNYLIRKQLATNSTGSQSYGHMIEVPDGRLIGLHSAGTGGYDGSLFSYNPIDSSYAVLGSVSFNTGSLPQGSPVYVPATGKVYGLCYNGGLNTKGVLWSHPLTPAFMTDEHTFDGVQGEFPQGELTLTSAGKLYGTTTSGGVNGLGVAFEFNPSNGNYSVTYQLDGSNGAKPNSVLLAEGCNNLNAGTPQTDELLCLGDTANFNAAFTGASSYQWYKNGVAIPGATQSSYSPGTPAVPADAGTYHVCSFDACAYKVNPPIQHAILGRPDPAIVNNGPDSLCIGQNTFSMTATNALPGLTYQWLLDGNIIAGAVNPDYTPQVTGAYSLIVTNQAGCDSISQALNYTSIDSVQGVTVNLSSAVSAICNPSTITFSVSAPLAGNRPFFSFFRNGTLVASDTLLSQNIFVASGDLIQVMMTPDVCAWNDSIYSNIISIVDTCLNLGISCSVNTTNVCSGGELEVSWNALSAPSVTNQYTVELSDLNGSFANPVNIGIITSNSLSGSLICNIPSSTPGGAGYRVRVNASSPASIGADNTVNINIVNNNFNLAFTANPSVITNPNRTTTFSNTTPNSSSYDFFWHFGDGTFQADNGLVVSHTYPNNGIFYPSLLAVSSAGCSDTLFSISNQITVNATGYGPCGFSATTTPSGSVNGCQGGSIDIAYSGNCNSCTYQWSRNGVPVSGGNLSQLSVTLPGFYSLKIIDTAGCVGNTQPVNVTFGQPAAIPPSITATGNLGLCAGGVNATLTANGNYAAYVWSNGATGNSINITQGGSYSVFGQGSAGCDGASLPFNVVASNLSPIEICMVSATPNSQDNQIVWNGPLGVNTITRFIIYREDLNQAGVFNPIGDVAYADSSTFIDTSANPNLRSYRYKLAIEDSCGGITLSSTPVQSMFLQVQPYIGTKRLLSWNLYQGQSQNISTYYIYSGSSIQNLNLIDSVNAPSSFYIDNQPVAGPGTIYRVEAGLSSVCEVIDRAAIGRNRTNTAGNLTIMSQEDIGESAKINFNLLPNPASDEVFVSFESSFSGFISIGDLSGRTLRVIPMNESNLQRIDLSELPDGLYLIEVKDAVNRISRKLMKM